MSKRAGGSQVQWRLMTELNPGSAAYGSPNLNGLRMLLDAGMKLRHVDGLHAKLFLTESQGFTGSANLTSAGLGASSCANAELSVSLDDAQRREAREVYASWWKTATKLDHAAINECEQDAAKIPVRIARPPQASQRRADQVAIANRLLDRATQAGTWVKAVYRGADDYQWDSPLVSSSAKGKPSFQPGDILVVYAKYARTCFTVLEVVGETTFDVQRQVEEGVPPAHADRWPWVTDVAVVMDVSPIKGVPLARMGLTGLSLHNGHCRMPVGGLAAALTAMTS